MTTTQEQVDLAYVDEVVERLGRKKAATIAILQALQDHYKYLPEQALRRVCSLTEITPAEITGVATFYSQFRHAPVGKHIVSVCDGTACHVKGAQRVVESLRRVLELKEGEDTDKKRMFTIQKVACLGCCTLAPAVQIDDVTYGHLTPDTVEGMLRDFLAYQEGKGKERHERHKGSDGDGVEGEIRLGLGSCCVSRGSGKLHEAVEEVLGHTGIRARVKAVGCVGMCHQTPLLEIVKEGESKLYAKVRPEDAKEILLKHFRPRGLVRQVQARVEGWLDRCMEVDKTPAVERYEIDVREKPVAAFLGKQRHLATEHCGVIDPVDLEEYRRRGGYEGLAKALAMGSDAVVAAVTASGLRGRGGAGYPTGRKWQAVREAAGQEKYLVCNGDEGDPGAFMDRMLLESYPYRVIEGMTIAAMAVGARRGWFYIRHEYPLAVRRVQEAIRRCRETGLLGEDILGSGLSFELEVMEGAGAFVCGEESALLASIEGKRGTPRLRPPYPAEKGLWGRPTLVNNVETYALVSWVLRQGAEAFGAMGTAASKGTKVFALAGKVARGGLIEVPMGITLREIVEEIGNGVAGDRKFKAVQVGGPSGGCVPAGLADIAVDYEALTGVGAIMGSGGLVVLDDEDCMVEIARYFLEFTQDQSCGKCTFCRVGTRRMLEILERLVRGEGRKGDLEALEELGEAVKRTSLCGLGQTAPNPVLSTLKYFREEYEAHLAGRCPAGSCAALVRYRITDECIGCTLCAQHCPVGAIEARPWEGHAIDDAVCVRCGTCRKVCPVEAVVVE